MRPETHRPRLLVGLMVVLSLACAGATPVLYPNAHYQRVGRPAADSDIAECRRLADQSGADRDPGRVTAAARHAAGGAAVGAVSGAVGGAIAGSVGRGSAIGAATGATAAMLRSLFAPKPVSHTHQAFVNRCLSERGYEAVGWD